MKREARQHGMVRTSHILPSPWNPRPERTYVKKLESPPTAGLFTRVSPKPTNHSKFTGKCGRPRCPECHVGPASKSKVKAKGTKKLGSCHLVSNNSLLTWRVVDVKPGFNVSRFSASGLLDHLSSDYMYDDDDVYESPCELNHSLVAVEYNCSENEQKIVDDDENDGEISFLDDGMTWEQVDGDEDWWLVGDSSLVDDSH